MKPRSSLNLKQIEELSKLLINLGHLFFGSLVLKIFEQSDATSRWPSIVFGLILSFYAYGQGVALLKHLKDGQYQSNSNLS